MVAPRQLRTMRQVLLPFHCRRFLHVYDIFVTGRLVWFVFICSSVTLDVFFRFVPIYFRRCVCPCGRIIVFRCACPVFHHLEPVFLNLHPCRSIHPGSKSNRRRIFFPVSTRLLTPGHMTYILHTYYHCIYLYVL